MTVIKMNFASKVVIVTGASSGIGAATAAAFAKSGALVTIVGRNEEKLNDVAETIRKISNKNPLVVKADVTKTDELKAIIEKTIKKHGKLDILVNNAGTIITSTILEDHFPESYDVVLNTNLNSVVLLTHYAAPHLIKSKGNIVNVSSVASLSPLGALGCGYAAYCTSKAGLDHFTRVSALEFSKHGVRVNAINPGPVETPIISSTGASDWDPFVQQTALKLLIQPEEVADMILYLASEKSRCVTGGNFLIDSGMKLLM